MAAKILRLGPIMSILYKPNPDPYSELGLLEKVEFMPKFTVLVKNDFKYDNGFI